jgi:hypothetical protein
MYLHGKFTHNAKPMYTTVHQCTPPIEGLANPRDVPTTAAQDAARRSLYNMAANECVALAQFWNGECRLRSFYVDETGANSDGPPEVRPRVPALFGSAVYELKPPGR